MKSVFRMSINCNLTVLCNSDLPDFTLTQLQSASVAELVVFYFLIGILWIQIEIMFVTGVNVTSEFFVDCNLAAFSFCIIRKARTYGSNHGNPKASCKLFKLLHRYTSKVLYSASAKQKNPDVTMIIVVIVSSQK